MAIRKKKKAVLSETHIFNFIYEQTAQEQAQIPLWDHYYYYYYHDCTKVTYIKYPWEQFWLFNVLPEAKCQQVHSVQTYADPPPKKDVSRCNIMGLHTNRLNPAYVRAACY